MQLDARKYLYVIQLAASLVVQFTGDKTFTDYQQDPMLRLAVERALTIIGEALSQLANLTTRSQHKSANSSASSATLIHAHAEVDDRIVWDVIERKLPTLRQQARDAHETR